MTASQITRVLVARDQRVPFSWQSVDLVLRKLKLGYQFTEEQVLDLYKLDSEYSQIVFADASLEECEQMVGFVAQRLGADKEFASRLRTLAPLNELILFSKYLQILHYQCSVSEYYDLAVKYMYEFKPRGRAVTALMEQYPDALISAANPFLNNAKAVDELTPGWVSSRLGRDPPGAAALYGILDNLQSLGFPARRELSAWLRMW